MKTILFVAAMLAAGAALGEDAILRQGQNVLRLTQAPCTDESVLNLIPPDYRAAFRRGFAIVDGHDFKACWAINADGQVFVIFEDGDISRIPTSAFSRDEGI